MTEKTAEKADSKTIIEKVMEFMKGGEKAKLAKFFKGVRKYLDDQIKSIEDRIERTDDKMEEKNEELEEYILTIDFDRVMKTEERSDYVKSYVAGYDKLVEQIEGLKYSIENDMAIIRRRKEMKPKVM